MFTCCPSCRTLFTVTAAQLRAGHGQVRCGQCRRSFDAIEELSDELPAAAEAQPDGDAPPAAADAALACEPHDAAQSHEHEVATVASSLAPAPGLAQHDRSAQHDELPHALRNDAAAPRAERDRGWIAAGGLFLTCIVLAGALVAQYGWSRTDIIVERYPQARNFVTTLCRSFGCALPATRDPSKMRIVARDVRPHPRYEGALLVTASMVNGGLVAQPYPKIEFTLYDINGQSIASRIFGPQDYAGVDPERSDPLPPLQPRQIALELLAPEEAIISFEFRFL